MELRHSESIGKLAEALAGAQLEFGTIKKATENPFFKSRYADLSTLIDATRPALAKHGLVVIQTPRLVQGRAVEVTTMLLHSSGEYIAHDLLLPGGSEEKFNAQTVGSAITYARRYSYQSLLNIAGEDDDDGNAASGKNGKSKSVEDYEQEYEQRSSAPGRIQQFQVNAFFGACQKHGKTPEQISAYLSEKFKIVQVEELTKPMFNDAIKWASTNGDLMDTLQTSVNHANGQKKPEQKDFRKLFAAAREHGLGEGDVKNHAYKYYEVNSLTELNARQVQELGEWVESQ